MQNKHFTVKDRMGVVMEPGTNGSSVMPSLIPHTHPYVPYWGTRLLRVYSHKKVHMGWLRSLQLPGQGTTLILLALSIQAVSPVPVVAVIGRGPPTSTFWPYGSIGRD